MGYNDSLGDRMKDNYESVTQSTLLRRTPVVIRVDGKAFHTFTKRINEANDCSLKNGPFSEKLHTVMMLTAKAMVHNIQNAVLAYVQSDEISILLKDWTTLTTDQWFGGNVQKMVSVSAAMASSYFNYFLKNVFTSYLAPDETDSNDNNLYLINPKVLPACPQQIPLFDSRVFNLPKEEVANYFLWRQLDASRNSVNMLGQFYFSHKELHAKNISQVQDMLMSLETPTNWNDLPTWQKRGACVLLNPELASSVSPVIVDDNIPIFSQNREYIEKLLSSEQDSK